MFSSSPTQPKVCVLILNWNGWKDTIECLESVYRLQGANFEVVVCDNDSKDDSLDRVESWARGELSVAGVNPELLRHVTPPVTKPVAVRRFASPDAAIATAAAAHGDVPHLTLIQTGANLGFAGGNNCGLRYAMARDDFDYVWLLNNDTVVTPDALSSLVAKMQTDINLGICGSILRDYWIPSRVHVRGGKLYSPWSGRVHANQDDKAVTIDYVDGASMLVRRSFLQRAGLMDESYFLYFEELSWSEAAAQHGFTIGFSTESVVYHKEGASTKTDPASYAPSLTAERFLARNRVYFTRRFHRWALATVIAWILSSAVRAALRRDWQRARVILAGLIEGQRLPKP